MDIGPIGVALVAGSLAIFNPVAVNGSAAGASDPVITVINVITKAASALERTGAAYGIVLIFITASISLIAVGALIVQRRDRSRPGSSER